VSVNSAGKINCTLGYKLNVIHPFPFSDNFVSKYLTYLESIIRLPYTFFVVVKAKTEESLTNAPTSNKSFLVME
jgi:hypothetical protein